MIVLVIMMNESAIINTIKEIQKDRNKKLDEIIDCKNKLSKLNEEMEVYDTKISWLKEDMEDVACNFFDNAKRIHINKGFEYIEIEFFVGSELNLSRIQNFAEMLGKKLDDCIVLCDADASLYLQINL